MKLTERINQKLKTKTGKLNLSGLGLNEIPKEIYSAGGGKHVDCMQLEK